MLGFHDKVLFQAPKSQILRRFLLNICKKPAVKHSIEKFILHHFVNSTAICSTLSEKQCSFLTRSRPIDFSFISKLQYFKRSIRFSNCYIRAAQLEQIPKYDIFQKSIFSTLVSSKILEPSLVPIAAGHYLQVGFTLFQIKLTFL